MSIQFMDTVSDCLAIAGPLWKTLGILLME